MTTTRRKSESDWRDTLTAINTVMQSHCRESLTVNVGRKDKERVANVKIRRQATTRKQGKARIWPSNKYGTQSSARKKRHRRRRSVSRFTGISAVSHSYEKIQFVARKLEAKSRSSCRRAGGRGIWAWRTRSSRVDIAGLDDSS